MAFLLTTRESDCCNVPLRVEVFAGPRFEYACSKCRQRLDYDLDAHKADEVSHG